MASDSSFQADIFGDLIDDDAPLNIHHHDQGQGSSAGRNSDSPLGYQMASATKQRSTMQDLSLVSGARLRRNISHASLTFLLNHEDESLAEAMRKRQRGYEKRYRQRRRSMYQRRQSEWFQLESTLHTLRVERSNAYVVVDGATSDVQHRVHMSVVDQCCLLVCEVGALQRDMVATHALVALVKLAKARHFDHETELWKPSDADWEHIIRELLGPNVMKLFAVTAVNFDW